MDRLTSAPKLTAGQKDYLDTLAILFEAYEKVHPPFEDEPISGVEMLKFLMEQHDMNASDLGRLLGERSLGGRVLKGERSLSKAHIRKLCEQFKVGPDLFWDFL
jgi:HTH-type transcriptional regulator/antitoxin HigA